MSKILYLNQSVRDHIANARHRAFMADDAAAHGAPQSAELSRARAAEYWEIALERAQRPDLPMPLAAEWRAPDRAPVPQRYINLAQEKSRPQPPDAA